jgi:translation initiation factor 2B subunit (eIF-2B alpha/beta/delta family)
MTGRGAVRVILRNRSEVLLRREAGEKRWGTVSGPADTDPERAARRELLDSTALSAAEFILVRTGDPVDIDVSSGHRRVHPFLFDCRRRPGGPERASDRTEWVPPTEILARETVPGLWETYDRVRPTVETVAGDTEHGSAHVSIRALAVLRDEAAFATRGGASETDGTAAGRSVAAVARDLLAARPSMTAVANRVHRAMAAGTPADIPPTAHDEISRARRVDGEAATAAGDLLGEHVATLSRSGTVRETLATADPEQVLVAESRPGREGVDTAAALARAANGPDVTLTTDAAFPGELADREVETLVVGADAVLADGRVVNKVGTRAAALSAAREGTDVVVVAASDKVSPGTGYDPEIRDPGEVYDGDTPVSVTNPTFGVTPPDVVDTVVTEHGVLDAGDVEEIAARHRSLREWEREEMALDATDET